MPEALSKFNREAHWARELAAHIGLCTDDVSDPLITFDGRQIGVDVIVTNPRQRLGIQVTEIDSAEGILGLGKGKLRAEEVRKAVSKQVYGMFSGNDPQLAIASKNQIQGREIQAVYVR